MIQLNWHIDISMITMARWHQPIGVSLDIGQPLALALLTFLILLIWTSAYIYGSVHVMSP
jgi:hypothetical protein